MRTKETDRAELINAAYQFRATIRLNVRSHRERQLAVERVDEGLLWALQGITIGPEPGVDETPPSEQS
jgi:hypothetical protein